MDDSIMIVSVVARVLAKAGCQVIKAYSCEGAVELVRDQKFDFILSDMCIGPSGSGVDVHRASILLGHRGGFAFMTSHCSEEQKSYAASNGIKIISKPFSTESIVQSVTGIHSM